jgi:outer membrane biosynthesis protein TonB
MSTILKALRRLEQEKSIRSDRPLGEAVAGAAPIPAAQAVASRRWPIFAGIAIGVVVLGVAAFAAIQWSRGGAESPVEVAAIQVKPDAPAVPGRKLAAPARAKANARAKAKAKAARRPRPTRNSRAKALAPSEPSPAAATSGIAVAAPSQPTPVTRFGASQLSAAAVGLDGTLPPGVSPVTPSSGEPPVIDLYQLEALQTAAKSAGKTPETIESARVAPISPATSPPTAEFAPPAPTPKAQPKPAPIEVVRARPAPEPVPTPAPTAAPEAEPKPKAAPRAEPTPKPTPEAEPKPDPKPVRSVARKSPPRPSGPKPPKVYVSRTVWHPDASRRIAYVALEGRAETVAVREGESIGPLIVTEIAPTGVSFDNRGSELTQRVGAR